MSHTNSTTNYGLPQFLSSDKPAWMADINVAFDNIDSQMKANADAAASAKSTADNAVLNGAPGYSNLSTYDVDDVVNYGGRVYKCIIAVTTPEAFDNAKWILYDLQDASKAIDDIDLELGSADISGIGDGSVKGAISEINSKLSSTRFNLTAISSNQNNFLGYGIFDATTNSVRIYAYAFNSTNPVDSTAVAEGIPEQYRPSSDIIIGVGTIYNGNREYRPSGFTVKSDGSITNRITSSHYGFCCVGEYKL